jgi:hypothetical protein
MTTTAKRKPPTPEEIGTQQKRDAAKSRALAKSPQAPASVPAPLAPDTRTPVQRYLDDVAPSSFVGDLVKFSKDGKFVLSKDGTPAPEEDFAALCDQTLVGYIKFSDEPDTPPERIQGLLYQGFELPPRESLGDLDETQWAEGLNGQPADPWQHQMMIPLQSQKTHQFYTFATSSRTGRRAVGNLLRHFDRMRRIDAGAYPIVRLQASGFEHKDSRIGWVPTPSFLVVGKAAADTGVMIKEPMNDEIPW